MTSQRTGDSRRLADELFREFGGTLPSSAIQGCLAQAIRDLNGSILPESLPEMAVRLARIRLVARAAQLPGAAAQPLGRQLG